ncbi:MAG: ribosomal RNA small subunit methyltransferase A [bacterium]
MLPIRKRKSIGQHLIINKDVILKICDIIIENITEDFKDFVLFEIGSGEGTLTVPLLQKLKNHPLKPCLTVLNEIDYRYIKKLQIKLAEMGLSKQFSIQFLQEDFLKVNLTNFDSKVYLVGNIPFYITGKLFRKITQNYEKIIQVVINIQREVADKISNPDNPLGIGLSLGWYVEKKLSLIPSFYNPQPKVYSQIVLMKNKYNPLFSDKWMNFVYKLFRKSNKTIKNLLTTSELSKLSLNDSLLNKRPLQLTVQEIVEIYKTLYGS